MHGPGMDVNYDPAKNKATLRPTCKECGKLQYWSVRNGEWVHGRLDKCEA